MRRLTPCGALRRRREPEIEIARLQRVLVVAQGRIVRRHRHREARRQPAVEQARALELVEPGQVADRVEPEMREEMPRWCRRSPAGRAPCGARADGSSRSPAARRPSPWRSVTPRMSSISAARHRLVIGDDRERLDRGARELARLGRFLAQEPGQVGGGAERPLAVDAHQIDAARGVFLLQAHERCAQVDALRQARRQLLLVERLAPRRTASPPGAVAPRRAAPSAIVPARPAA